MKRLETYIVFHFRHAWAVEAGQIRLVCFPSGTAVPMGSEGNACVSTWFDSRGWRGGVWICAGSELYCSERHLATEGNA